MSFEEWSRTEDRDYRCRHGLDLRIYARCYLCVPIGAKERDMTEPRDPTPPEPPEPRVPEPSDPGTEDDGLTAPTDES